MATPETAGTSALHLFGLLNYFTRPVINALTEGFNPRIQAIKAEARSFRSIATTVSAPSFTAASSTFAQPSLPDLSQ